MKKITLFGLFIISILANDLYANDTNIVKFIPLKVGNMFVFRCSTYSNLQLDSIYNVKSIISKDTVANGKKYFFMGNYPPNSYKNQWIRIDSVTGSVYRFNPNETCLYYEFYELIDSLIININGDVYRCGEYVKKCNNINSNYISFNYHFRIGPIAQSTEWGFTKNFGLTKLSSTSTYWASGTAQYHDLIGCIIDGVLYGDTSLNTTNIEPISNIAQNYTLSQNYPNPFNPTTTIKFQIPKLEFVNLKIYDLIGREIETLISENLNTGEYSVSWNASNFPSGMYFYKLYTDGFTETKKMLLIK